METLLNFFLHLDARLAELVQQYGVWVYGILFLIVFAETGLVVTPFLPGDSLLFAIGVLGAHPASPINLPFTFGLLMLATLLGDNSNYWIGYRLGPAVFRRESSRLLNKKH